MNLSQDNECSLKLKKVDLERSSMCEVCAKVNCTGCSANPPEGAHELVKDREEAKAKADKLLEEFKSNIQVCDEALHQSAGTQAELDSQTSELVEKIRNYMETSKKSLEIEELIKDAKNMCEEIKTEVTGEEYVKMMRINSALKNTNIYFNAIKLIGEMSKKMGEETKQTPEENKLEELEEDIKIHKKRLNEIMETKNTLEYTISHLDESKTKLEKEVDDLKKEKNELEELSKQLEEANVSLTNEEDRLDTAIVKLKQEFSDIEESTEKGKRKQSRLNKEIAEAELKYKDIEAKTELAETSLKTLIDQHKEIKIKVESYSNEHNKLKKEIKSSKEKILEISAVFVDDSLLKCQKKQLNTSLDRTENIDKLEELKNPIDEKSEHQPKESGFEKAESVLMSKNDARPEATSAVIDTSTLTDEQSKNPEETDFIGKFCDLVERLKKVYKELQRTLSIVLVIKTNKSSGPDGIAELRNTLKAKLIPELNNIKEYIEELSNLINETKQAIKEEDKEVEVSGIYMINDNDKCEANSMHTSLCGNKLLSIVKENQGISLQDWNNTLNNMQTAKIIYLTLCNFKDQALIDFKIFDDTERLPNLSYFDISSSFIKSADCDKLLQTALFTRLRCFMMDNIITDDVDALSTSVSDKMLVTNIEHLSAKGTVLTALLDEISLYDTGRVVKLKYLSCSYKSKAYNFSAKHNNSEEFKEKTEKLIKDGAVDYLDIKIMPCNDIFSSTAEISCKYANDSKSHKCGKL